MIQSECGGPTFLDASWRTLKVVTDPWHFIGAGVCHSEREPIFFFYAFEFILAPARELAQFGFVSTF